MRLIFGMPNPPAHELDIFRLYGCVSGICHCLQGDSIVSPIFLNSCNCGFITKFCEFLSCAHEYIYIYIYPWIIMNLTYIWSSSSLWDATYPSLGPGRRKIVAEPTGWSSSRQLGSLLRIFSSRPKGTGHAAVLQCLPELCLQRCAKWCRMTQLEEETGK